MADILTFVSPSAGFHINLPCGGVTIFILALINIPNAALKSSAKLSIVAQLKSLDLLGFAIFAPAICMLLLALEWGGVDYAWNSAMVIGLLCGSVGALGVFTLWEHRCGEDAMIPLSVLRNLKVTSAVLTAIFSNGALMLLTYYLPIWFQVVKSASPTMSGVYHLPTVVSQILSAIIAGVLRTLSPPLLRLPSLSPH